MTEPEVALFPISAPNASRLSHGRVRRGLDTDVAAADAAGTSLPAAGVAVLRSVADQIDALERHCRTERAKPYDRVPLAGLVRQFGETYAGVFAETRTEVDPLVRALAEFSARDRDRRDSAPDDAAGPVLSD